MATSIQTVKDKETTSPWRQLIGIIDQPITTLKIVLPRPGWSTWAIPLAVLLLAFATNTVVQMPYTLDVAREQAESQLASLPAQQAEAARETMKFTLSLPFMLATGLGVGTIILVGGIVLQAAFFYFGTLIVGGADVSYGSLFRLSTWSRIPMALGYLTLAAFTAFSQSGIQYPGLGFLVTTGNPLEDARNPLVPLLSSLDLFWLWHLLLVGLGLSMVARLSWGKSLGLTVLWMALTLGLTVLPSLIFSSGLGG